VRSAGASRGIAGLPQEGGSGGRKAVWWGHIELVARCRPGIPESAGNDFFVEGEVVQMGPLSLFGPAALRFAIVRADNRFLSGKGVGTAT
jgi:hypothetical protein